MNILDNIINARTEAVKQAKLTTDVARLAEHARAARRTITPHRFSSAIVAEASSGIIGEFKRASPSKGMINGSYNPADIADFYKRGGACAISVLTEEEHFKGSLEDLLEVRRAVDLPIIRKDFIVDHIQIFEAAVAGADAILLIVAALPEKKLDELLQTAHTLGMDALVEVHTVDEMKIAAKHQATTIGVNNRNLRTFEVSLDVSRELVRSAPTAAILVSESGIRSRQDIDDLRRLGYSGFLVGESLMRSADPEAALRTLAAAEGAR